MSYRSKKVYEVEGRASSFEISPAEQAGVVIKDQDEDELLIPYDVLGDVIAVLVLLKSETSGDGRVDA